MSDQSHRETEALVGGILTWAAEGVRWLPDGELHIDAGGRLAAIERTRQAGYFDRLLLPGLIDVHTHLPQYPMVARDGLRLLPWLERHIFPCERDFEPDRAERLAPAFFHELARNGTTAAVVYASIHEQSCERCFQAAERSGLRVVLGKVMMDRHSYGDLPEDAILAHSLEQSARLCRRWNGAAGGRLGYAFAPRFALSCSRELMSEAGRLAAELGAFVQTHLAETMDEVAAVRQQYPEAADYTDVYERYGLLGRRSIFGHGIHLSPRELERLIATGSSIAHCPAANLFLASGVLPLAERLAAGSRMGLGTDVAAGPELSLWLVMKAGLYAQKARAALVGGELVSPLEYLRLATLGGAEVLGAAAELGSLELGKRADLIVIDTAPLLLPGESPDVWERLEAGDVAARLIYRSHPDMVREVWIDGRVVWRRPAAFGWAAPASWGRH